MADNKVAKTHAIHFAEGGGKGYIFCQPLSVSSEGNYYLVRSLADNKIVTRLRISRKMTWNAASFYHRLGPKVAPKMLHRSNYGKEGDAIYFSFCNGGPFEGFIQKFVINQKHINEVLFWHFVCQMTEILAYIHAGWTHESGLPRYWQPIAHGDMHQDSILVHWQNEMDAFPRFFLSKWTSGSVVDDQLLEKSGKWRKLQVQELGRLMQILFTLNKWRFHPISEDDDPILQFQRLWHDARDAEPKHGRFCYSQYIAERLVPMAKQKIDKMTATEPADFSWAKPAHPKSFTKFGSISERDENLERWTKIHNDGRSVRQPWEWIEMDDVDDNPLRVEELEIPDALGDNNTNEESDYDTTKGLSVEVKVESQKRDSKGLIIMKTSISTTSLPGAISKRVKRVSFCEDVEEIVTNASDGEISRVKFSKALPSIGKTMGKTIHPNAKKEEKPRGFFGKLKDDRDNIVTKTMSQVSSNIDRVLP